MMIPDEVKLYLMLEGLRIEPNGQIYFMATGAHFGELLGVSPDPVTQKLNCHIKKCDCLSDMAGPFDIIH